MTHHNIPANTVFGIHFISIDLVKNSSNATISAVQLILCLLFTSSLVDFFAKKSDTTKKENKCKATVFCLLVT